MLATNTCDSTSRSFSFFERGVRKIIYICLRVWRARLRADVLWTVLTLRDGVLILAHRRTRASSLKDCHAQGRA